MTTTLPRFATVRRPRCVPARTRSAPRGLSLIVVLLILIVVSILGVGAAQMGLLGERASRYDRDYQMAWQSAEAAIDDAVLDMDGNTHSKSRSAGFGAGKNENFTASCGEGGSARAGLCEQAASMLTPVWQTIDFQAQGKAARYVEFGEFTGRAFQSGAVGVQPAAKPRYVIENLPDFHAVGESPGGGEASYYRVTAVGYGPRIETQVAIQAIYRKAEQ